MLQLAYLSGIVVGGLPRGAEGKLNDSFVFAKEQNEKSGKTHQKNKPKGNTHDGHHNARKHDAGEPNCQGKPPFLLDLLSASLTRTL